MISHVCQSVMWLCCANTAEWIEVLHMADTLGDARHIILILLYIILYYIILYYIILYYIILLISVVDLMQPLPNYFCRLFFSVML